jgi:hypothetical protein
MIGPCTLVLSLVRSFFFCAFFCQPESAWAALAKDHADMMGNYLNGAARYRFYDRCIWIMQTSHDPSNSHNVMHAQY